MIKSESQDTAQDYLPHFIPLTLDHYIKNRLYGCLSEEWIDLDKIRINLMFLYKIFHKFLWVAFERILPTKLSTCTVEYIWD